MAKTDQELREAALRARDRAQSDRERFATSTAEAAALRAPSAVTVLIVHTNDTESLAERAQLHLRCVQRPCNFTLASVNVSDAAAVATFKDTLAQFPTDASLIALCFMSVELVAGTVDVWQLFGGNVVLDNPRRRLVPVRARRVSYAATPFGRLMSAPGGSIREEQWADDRSMNVDSFCMALATGVSGLVDLHAGASR